MHNPSFSQADKAKEQAEAKGLQRQTLDGDKINAGENYDNEHAEFVIVAPPADRSIFILQVKLRVVDTQVDFVFSRFPTSHVTHQFHLILMLRPTAQVIMQKIDDFCAKGAADSAA
jgi:hypothetical protein